jgi:hypothetical protein
MTENVFESEPPSSSPNKGVGRRLDAAGWGLFFIWVGVSLLLDLSWGVGLLGVAAIIFIKQTARRFYGRRLESFWVVVGALFLLGGIWELGQVQLDLPPILLIGAGGALLLTLFRGRSRNDAWGWCGRGWKGGRRRYSGSCCREI